VRTARAKGLRPRRRPPARAAETRCCRSRTIIGLQTGLLLSGAVLTETDVRLAGRRQLAEGRDLQPRTTGPPGRDPLPRRRVVIVNLLVDLSYAIINRRIRLS
jgi:peptide/nickel transport system permease protein